MKLGWHRSFEEVALGQSKMVSESNSKKRLGRSKISPSQRMNSNHSGEVIPYGTEQG